MRFILLTLLLVPFLLVSRLRAQEFVPVFENIKDALPSTEVHDIFQDSVGYMWFATDRGICRYNGDEIKIINTAKDINTNVFFKFFKETETKIWLVTDNQRLYWFNPYLSKPTFHALPQNEALSSMSRQSKYPVNISDIKFQKNGIIILCRQNPGFFFVGNNGSCEWYDAHEESAYSIKKTPIVDLNVIEKNGFSYIQLSAIKPNQKDNFIKFQSSSFTIDNNSPTFFTIHFGIAVDIMSQGSNYLGISNYLFRKSGNKVTRLVLPSAILSILPHNNQLLIGTLNGVYVINQQFEVESVFLNGFCITKLFESNSGDVWISTLQKGVFISRNLSMKEMKLPKNIIASTVFNINQNIGIYDEIANQIFFLDIEHRIFMRLDKTILSSNLFRTENPKVPDLMRNKISYQFDEVTNVSFQYIVENESSSDYFIYVNRIFQRQGNEYKTFHSFKGKIGCNFAYQFNPNKLVIGTDHGLYFLNSNTKKIESTPIKNSMNLRFISFIKLEETVYMLSNRGIHYFQDGVLKFLHVHNYTQLKKIYKQSETTAWIYSDTKIHRLKIVNDQPTISQKAVYSSWDEEGAIKSLITYRDELWIATKKGLFITKINSEGEHTRKRPFKFKLDSVSVNSKLINNISNLSTFTDDDITLYFDIICLDPSISRPLEFSLDGEKWLAMNKNSLTLANLRADQYTLLVRRIDAPDQLIYKLPFTVNKRFYQRWWFVLTELLLLAFVIYYIIRKIVRLREKKRNEELEKLNLELKLLTSKMNPHFTFNTINSIQYYILKSDKKEAIQYLSDFALLIRKSLEFSMAERITLEEEIHFLSLYVKMENKRFDSNFRLKFQNYPPEIVQRKKIPSMLIQPLVENIILHAGYSEADDKIIQIIINSQNGFFTIQVIDFGKGISPKKELNKHKSYGIDILRSRVKIYNGSEFKESDVSIHSTSNGTTVNIRLKEWD